MNKNTSFWTNLHSECKFVQNDDCRLLALSTLALNKRPKQSKGRNLLDRLITHEQAVLAFAFEVGVPFTNNEAERALQHLQRGQ